MIVINKKIIIVIIAISILLVLIALIWLCPKKGLFVATRF